MVLQTSNALLVSDDPVESNSWRLLCKKNCLLYRIIEYSARDDTKLLRFCVDTVPLRLAKHVDVLMNFVSYMDKNLSSRHKDECSEKVIASFQSDAIFGNYSYACLDRKG